MRIITSLDQYAVIVAKIGTEVTQGEVRAMRATRERMDKALKSAESKIGSGGVMHRVGRATGEGTRAGGRASHVFQVPNLTTVIVRARGVWPLADNSFGGGSTAAHEIGPRPDRNPRPIREGGKYRPSLKFQGSGELVTKSVTHPGSARRPLWRNFVQFVQPTISKLHRDEWNASLARAIG